MKSLAFFNNKGGVGKTTLTFHLAHMLARLGKRTVVLDYDPQCNISSIFLDVERLFSLWEDGSPAQATVAGCIDPVRRGRGGLADPVLTEISENLWLLPGHLSLTLFEQTLAGEWPKTMASDNERALDVVLALDLLSNRAAALASADLLLFDVGPNLGALNRAALLGCDAIILPLAPDLFSLQGMRNVGPTLHDWRVDWGVVRERHMQGRSERGVPAHEFRPIGYIVQQHLARADRPVSGYARWAEQIPAVFHRDVLRSPASTPIPKLEEDPSCIAQVKHFSSLVPIAQAARKPMFDLKQADGIGGGQIQSVARCRQAFEALAQNVVTRLEAPAPSAAPGRPARQ